MHKKRLIDPLIIYLLTKTCQNLGRSWWLYPLNIKACNYYRPCSKLYPRRVKLRLTKHYLSHHIMYDTMRIRHTLHIRLYAIENGQIAQREEGHHLPALCNNFMNQQLLLVYSMILQLNKFVKQRFILPAMNVMDHPRLIYTQAVPWAPFQ